MDGGWALILSAVVTAVGGIIVTLLAQFRKENPCSVVLAG
jgi:hypothetical protein